VKLTISHILFHSDKNGKLRENFALKDKHDQADRKDPLGRLELELTFSQPNVCCGCCRTRCCKLFCPHCHACHPLRDNKTVRSDLEAHNKKKRLQAEEAARRADLKKKMEDGIAKAGEAKRKMKKEHDDKRAAKRKQGVKGATAKVGRAMQSLVKKPTASRGSIVI
jgi:hypothetical protein